MSAISFRKAGRPIRTFLIWCVRGYQVVISPALPQRCKYYPSCSQYAIDAVREYGALRGFVLACWRLLRCNPWSLGGYDPVQRQNVFGRRSSRVSGQACCATHGRSSQGRVA